MSVRIGHEVEVVTRQANRNRVLLLKLAALTLAALLGALSFCSQSLPVTSQWCAILASGCLNVLAVAVWSSRPTRKATRRGRKLGWFFTAVSAWRIFWQHRSAGSLVKTVRTIRWQPWAASIFACSSIAFAMGALRPLPPDAVVHAMVAQSLVIASGAIILVLAFFALVAERIYSEDARRAGDSRTASLAGMLRVFVLLALTASVSTAYFVYLHTTLNPVLSASAIFSAAIATEIFLRLVVSCFSAPDINADFVPSSTLAGLLRWGSSPFSTLGAELNNRYGIDLRQNWVLRSSVRLLPGTVASMVVCAWLLTSIVVLSPNQRAVYERFGAPIAVWPPGLHAGMPWPFGKVRIVDNGAVHQIIVSGGVEDGSVVAPHAAADGSTPEQLNRLWDVQHPGETTQVIAGASGEQQGFQILNADVRLDYRVGPSDEAARAALYRSNDLEATIRSIANRELVHYLASHTLQSLLETSQSVMAQSIQRAVQQQLDRLISGIEVVAVVIEAVHPPAGAAAAYHGVQAAQIRAQASVALAHAFAAEVLGNAQQEALSGVAQASADAADTMALARAQQIDFDADMDAERLGGPAFGFEYYLSHLQQGLQNARMTVIDDRLLADRRATIDLRSLTAGDLAGIPRGN